MKRKFWKKWYRKASCLLAVASLLAAEPGMAYAAEAQDAIEVEDASIVNEGNNVESFNGTDEITNNEVPNTEQQEEIAQFFSSSKGHGNYHPDENKTYVLVYTYDDNGVCIEGCLGVEGEGSVVPGGGEGKLLIPDVIEGKPVTGIGNSAFSGCSGFTGDLIIPASVTSIDNSAFRDCSGFTGDLIIPASVTSIGDYVFSGCSGFTGDLTIPASVTSIGDYVFSGCSGFTGDLNILAKASIGDKTFSGCKGFTGNLTVSGDVGFFAFSGCSGFTGNLIISDSVTSIGDDAFSGCSGFTGDLVIPSSVTSIGSYAFSNCSGFTTLTISDGVASIGGGAFCGCSGFTGDLTIPTSVTSIGNTAFYGCSGFTGSLTIPTSVTSIGDNAFMKCSGFTGDLIIPDSVTHIGGLAFVNCTGLNKNVYLSDKTTDISYYYALLTPLLHEQLTEGEWVGADNFPNDSEELRKSVIIHAPKNSYAEEWATSSFIGCTFVPYRMLTSGDNISVGYGEDDNAETGISLETRHLEVSDSEYGDINISDKLIDATVKPESVKFEAYDIALVDVNKQPVQPSGNVRVSIPCPAGYTGASCKVYRINDDGSLTDMKAACSGSYIVFFTRNLNTYIITEAELKTVMPSIEPTYDAKGLVERFYTELLGREGETDGIAGWTEKLETGDLSAIFVGYFYVDGDEFKDLNLTNDEYLERLYKTFMGRASDPDGKAYWLERLDAGFTRDYIYLNFAVLTEFTEICDKSHIRRGETDEIGKLKEASEAYVNQNLKVSKYITRCYTKVLNRPADAEGVEFWCGQIITKAMEAKAAAEAYVLSEEFVSKNKTDEEYVEVLYQTFFGRAGDKAGTDYWLGQLSARAMTRDDVLHAFSATPEFAEILAGFGL